jgi:hypothetical protein
VKRAWVSAQWKIAPKAASFQAALAFSSDLWMALSAWA